MKILWISHDSGLEGAERCLVEAIKGLSNKGEEMHVIVPAQGTIVPMLENITASIHILSHPWWIKELKDGANPVKRFYQYWGATVAIAKLLQQIKPDLVVTNTIVAPCGAFASKFLGIAHVWYIHEFFEEDHGLTFEFGRRLSVRIIDWLSHSIVVNSKAVHKRFNQHFSDSKMHLICYAVEIPNELNRINKIERNSESFLITLVGRKTQSKGQEDAIKALSILVKKNLDVYLRLVGRSVIGYTDYLQKFAQDLEVSHRVEFVSFVNNPWTYRNHI